MISKAAVRNAHAALYEAQKTNPKRRVFACTKEEKKQTNKKKKDRDGERGKPIRTEDEMINRGYRERHATERRKERDKRATKRECRFKIGKRGGKPTGKS